MPVDEEAAAPVSALTLFEMEQELAALYDTEAVVPAKQRTEFERELADAIQRSVAKRDRFAKYILEQERLAEVAKAESARLAELAAYHERAAERARAFGVYVIESLGQDKRGKYKSLEGEITVLGLRGGVPHVDITDAAAVPSKFKTLTLTIAAEAWESHVQWCIERLGPDPPIVRDVKKAEVSIEKKKIKAAIESGEQVPGADLKFGSPSLVIR